MSENYTTNLEEQTIVTVEPIEINASQDHSINGIDENDSREPVKVIANKPKNAIEILKVELVAAGRNEIFGTEDSSCMEENFEKEESPLQNLINEVEKENFGSEVNNEDEQSSLQSSSNEIGENRIEQKSEDNTVHMNLSELFMNERNDQSIQTKIAENTNAGIAQVLSKNISENKKETPLVTSNSKTTTGLSLLAQYESDNDDEVSDTDSVIEVLPSGAQDYRNKVVEINSDSDSDDSSDSSEVEYLNELRKTIEKRIELADEDDDEDVSTGKKKHVSKLKVKGELLLDELPPIEDLQITVPEDECIELGKIHSIVDQLVLISVKPNSILLDLDTVIFLEKGRKVLGQVFDVLGQVADPLYCVRFNSNEQIKDKEIMVGDVVYVAPKTQYTQYVILSNLMKLKGSDASWENDVEPPPRFIDYSDDEQEQLARRQLRNKDRPTDDDDTSKRPRTENNENINTTRFHSYAQQRNRRFMDGNNRGDNLYSRSRHIGPQHNQQRIANPNHHHGSWHSNYHAQSYIPRSAYSMQSANNQPQTSQNFPPHVPMYGMPLIHHMPYSPPPQRYGTPPMLHPQSSQPMPNRFSIRQPTLHGPPPHLVHHHQHYTSPPPPPPGDQ